MRSRSQHAIEIMRGGRAGVCGGLEIGVDEDQKLIGGARYRDKRPVAVSMWQTVMETLQAIGALKTSDKEDVRGSSCQPAWWSRA